jgi:hypothetical protein
MLRNHSGIRKWPLRGDAGENPAFAHSGNFNFDLKNLPLMTDKLANYLFAIQLTFYGTYNINVTTGNTLPLQPHELTRCLIDTVDLQGAWHGRPLSAQHVRGATLPIIEHMACGYQWGSRHRMPFHAAAAGAQTFVHTVTLPLAYFIGEKGHHTAQLALFYKDGQLIVNTAAAAILAAINPNATITSTTVRASALLLPEPELRIGPAQEWLEFRQSAQAGNDIVDLDSLGNMTALEGVEPGAGIDFMLALAAINGQLGSFTCDTITRFSAPFRGQTQTNHIEPFVHEWEQQFLHGEGADRVVRNSETAAQLRTGFADPRAAWPFEPLAGAAGATAATVAGSTLPANLRGFPILVPAGDLETTKVQVMEGTQSYFLTATFSGTHRTLVHQFKSWTPQKLADARQMIIDSGMAVAVEKTAQLEWAAKVTRKNGSTINPAKARFFPLRLKPAA